MQAMYAQVMKRHGRLDAMVANAGVGDVAPLGSITESSSTSSLNLIAVWREATVFTEAERAALELSPASGDKRPPRGGTLAGGGLRRVGA
jgi:hypothetical protein